MPQRHRDRNFSDPRNWIMRCSACGQTFGDDQHVIDIAAHYAESHRADKPRLDLVWVGVGPAPLPPPRIRAYADHVRKLVN